jgi:small multidrug resistance family-3 protein
MVDVLKSLALFMVAGLCEIGGGYLFWLWLREGKSFWLAVIGTVILVIYATIPNLQTVSFGRAYAAYGGIFVILSIFWGWGVEGITPDRYDWLGGWIALVGVLVIMFAPRS